MKKSILLVLQIMFITFSYAQNPLAKQWDKRFGGNGIERLTCFQQTTDGGFILGGYSDEWSFGGDKTQVNWDYSDYWIVKIDSLGNKQWDKIFGGDGQDVLSSLQQTADGGYILGGTSTSSISGDKTQSTWGLSDDYWIVKIDSLGNKQWDKDFGGLDDDYLYSLQQTTDGGYILGGQSHSGIGGDKTQSNWDVTHNTCDYWIVKIDASGNKQWDRRFGGYYEEMFYSLQQTADGGYILGGWSRSFISGDKTQNSWGNGHDYWIVKVDSLGIKQWDKDYGSIGTDELHSLQQTTDGGYILGGKTLGGISGDKTQASYGMSDYWIVKTDSLGNMQWDKDYGGTQSEDYFGYVKQTKDGGYLISGSSCSPIGGVKTEDNLGTAQTWVLKTDSIGNIQWDKTCRTTGFDIVACYAIEAKDGTFAMANYTNGGIGGHKTQPNWDTTNITYDYWIIKFCDTTGLNVALPIASLTSSNTIICQNQGTDFFDLSTNVPANWQPSWHWYFPGASPNSSIMQNPTNIHYNSPGFYTVTLVVSNYAGSDSITMTNFINVTPAPLLSLGNDTTICIGDSLLLDAGSGFNSYLWSDNSTTQSITVPSPGVYSVAITSGLCSSTDTITVSTQSCIPLVSVASSDTSFCENTCIDFSDLSTNNPTSWQWFFPGADSLTSTLQNPPNVCYKSYGTYDVTLIACNNYGCDTLQLTNFITVNKNPVALYTLYPSPTPHNWYAVNQCTGTPPLTYVWNWGDSSAVSTGATPSHTYSDSGYYNICVTVTDGNGCVNTYCDSSTYIYKGNSNSPVTINVVMSLPSGIDDIDGNSAINIYPVPVHDVLYVSLNEPLPANSMITINDMQGRVVKEEKILQSKSSVIPINVSALSRGVYLLRVDGVVRRFVKL